MRRGHTGNTRQWQLMLMGTWDQVLVKHFVPTSHLVKNTMCFRSTLAACRFISHSSLLHFLRSVTLWAMVTPEQRSSAHPMLEKVTMPLPSSLTHWSMCLLSVFLRPTSWKLQAVVAKAGVFTQPARATPEGKCFLSQSVEFHHLQAPTPPHLLGWSPQEAPLTLFAWWYTQLWQPRKLCVAQTNSRHSQQWAEVVGGWPEGWPTHSRGPGARKSSAQRGDAAGEGAWPEPRGAEQLRDHTEDVWCTGSWGKLLSHRPGRCYHSRAVTIATFAEYLECEIPWTFKYYWYWYQQPPELV